MNPCAFCRNVIVSDYFRVGSLIACPACVEKEHARDIATRRRYLWRGLFFATAMAVAVSLGLWGINELLALAGGGGLFSMAAFVRGAAVFFSGTLIGAAAIHGAKRRGSRALQVCVVVLTYLAWAMSFAWLLLERAPPAALSTTRVVVTVLMGPILPWLLIIRNPLGISGLIVVSLGCTAAWGKTARLNLVSGPFRAGDPTPAKPMFSSLEQ